MPAGKETRNEDDIQSEDFDAQGTLCTSAAMSGSVNGAK